MGFLNRRQNIIVNEKDKSKVYQVQFKPTNVAYNNQGKTNEMAVVYLTTSPSWNSINNFFSPKYEKVLSETLPPQLEAIVNKIKPLKSSKQKIELASKELSKLIAYSGNWATQQGKYTPQKFSDLIASKRGDCKDYSSALVAILRKAGFNSYPALTIRTERYLGLDHMMKLSLHPNMMLFNHAIVWAEDENKKVWWVDPTNPLVVGDMVLNDILGNFALILDNKSQNVHFLPEKNSINNDAVVEYNIKLNIDNTVQATGIFLL